MIGDNLRAAVEAQRAGKCRRIRAAMVAKSLSPSASCSDLRPQVHPARRVPASPIAWMSSGESVVVVCCARPRPGSQPHRHSGISRMPTRSSGRASSASSRRSSLGEPLHGRPPGCGLRDMGGCGLARNGFRVAHRLTAASRDTGRARYPGAGVMAIDRRRRPWGCARLRPPLGTADRACRGSRRSETAC